MAELTTTGRNSLLRLIAMVQLLRLCLFCRQRACEVAADRLILGKKLQRPSVGLDGRFELAIQAERVADLIVGLGRVRGALRSLTEERDEDVVCSISFEGRGSETFPPAGVVPVPGSLPVVLDGLVEPAFAAQGVGEIEVGTAHLGMDRHGLVIVVQCLLDLAATLVNVRQIEVEQEVPFG